MHQQQTKPVVCNKTALVGNCKTPQEFRLWKISPNIFGLIKKKEEISYFSFSFLLLFWQQGEIVLMEVRTKDHQTKQKGTLHPKLILECNSIVKITAKDVNLDYSSKRESHLLSLQIVRGRASSM